MIKNKQILTYPSLVTCNLIDLLPGTNYYFIVKAYNDEDQMVTEEIGTFATSSIATLVDALKQTSSNLQKVLHNGNVFIIRDCKIYNIMGAEIK